MLAMWSESGTCSPRLVKFTDVVLVMCSKLGMCSLQLTPVQGWIPHNEVQIMDALLASASINAFIPSISDLSVVLRIRVSALTGVAC